MLKKIGFIFSKIEYLFLALAMLSTTLLLFVNVILRYVFSSAIFWTEETLRYLIVWITFIGAATCIIKGSHISLDILIIFLPKKYHKIIHSAVNAICLIFSILFFWYSLKLTLTAREFGQISATIGNFPMYIVYSCMPLGSFLMICRFGYNLLGEIFPLISHNEKSLN